MDEADRAQVINEQYQADALAKHANRQQRMVSALRCLECGEEIPKARREAMPGCEYCVKCQKWLEQGHGFWP